MLVILKVIWDLKGHMHTSRLYVKLSDCCNCSTLAVSGHSASCLQYVLSDFLLLADLSFSNKVPRLCFILTYYPQQYLI